MTVPPALAVEVTRPLLDELLEDASTHRVTVVTAGPGWGKSTVVASWVRRRRTGSGHTAWLSLEPGDNNPASFWGAVLRAILRSGAVPAGHPLTLATTAAGVNDEVLLTVSRGLGALPEPLLIVLDDFQVVTDPGILAALAELVDHETQLRLMLVTRVDPALPLHRLRLSGDLAEVRAADLAFDAAAVHDLASRAESLDLSPDQVGRLLHRTEGWPAGVRLATLYLAGEPEDPDLSGFGGTDKSVAEFLMAEVLERHDARTREFLVRTSVVERVTADLADAIVPEGEGEGLARLEMLARANHFVACVDAERDVYRYHPLLRDLLLHGLRRDDPQGYRDAHRAAARWLVPRGDAVGALRHAGAAEDWRLVAEILFETAPSLVGSERFAVREQLQAIPYETLPTTASLELCAAAAELVSGALEAVGAHVENARHQLTHGDALPPMGAALLENLSAVAARWRGDVPGAIAASTAALTHLAGARPGPATDGLRTIAVSQRAISQLWAGDTSSARNALRRLDHDSRPGTVALTMMSVRANEAVCLLMAGQLDDADAAAHEVLERASARGWASLLQARPAYLVLAMTDSLRGDAVAADRLVAAGLAAHVGGEEMWPAVALRVTQASVAVSHHRPRAASAAMAAAFTAAAGMPAPGGLVDMMARAETEVALLAGRGRDSRSGEDVAQESRSATCFSGQARLALARADLEAAHAAASSVPRPPDTDGLDDTLAAVEAWLVLALVAERQGRLRETHERVRSAVDLARGQRLVRPFLVIEPERTATFLHRLQRLSIAAGGRRDEFLADVLARLTRQDGSLREPAPLLEPLSARELAVLAQLPSMKTNADIASEFYVSINTVKSQLQHLFRKLGVSSRREAVRRGRELGLID